MFTVSHSVSRRIFLIQKWFLEMKEKNAHFAKISGKVDAIALVYQGYE